MDGCFPWGLGGKVGSRALLYFLLNQAKGSKDRAGTQQCCVSVPVDALGYWIFILQEGTGSPRK